MRWRRVVGVCAGAWAVGVLAVTAQRLWPIDYPSFPESAHYDLAQARFFNTPALQPVTDRKGQRSALWQMVFQARQLVPPAPLPVAQADWVAFAADEDAARFIWLGHSSLLMRAAGHTVLLDPVWAERASPLPGLGKRFAPPPVPLQALPPIDLVLYSHSHYDHFDEQVVRHLAAGSTRFAVPLGMGVLLQRLGIADTRIHELDWWQSLPVGGLKLHAVPARHSSGRLRWRDTDRSLWAGWVLETAEERFYFSGDTSWGTHFAEIGQRFGGFDLAFIETGQYNAVWADFHLMPEQSVQAAIDVQARRFMPVHWGAYPLAVHTWDEPVRRSVPLAQARGLSPLTPLMGQVFKTNSTSHAWWQDLHSQELP